MTEYETVTVVNLYDPASAPLWQWQFFTQDPSGGAMANASVVEAAYLHVGGTQSRGWWMQWLVPSDFPASVRSELNPDHLLDGRWRRPVEYLGTDDDDACDCAKDLKEMSEAEALAKFFATPAGAWKGWQA